MTIYAFIDGASRNNPGESGIGILLKDHNGEVLRKEFSYIGTATNNIAEYTALRTCLQMVRSMECSKLVVHSDSELMVKQLHGKYRVKDATLKKHFQEVHKLLQDASFEFEIKHVMREKNKEADELANLGIDTKRRMTV
ncbi:MAG: ribonuclease HI family protein [Ignavibacteriae bacterium]|nr:ribonuclease HI family protein [Ignavibacteriota bacterium]